MISIVLRLAVIALLVYAGVSFWYSKMGERLQEQPHPVAERKEDTVLLVQDQEKGEPIPATTGYGIIVTRNIFQAGLGSAGYGSASFRSDEDRLEQTKLNLVLLGTVIGDANDDRAIIRDEQTKLEDLYQIGSVIQGARINKISRGKVVLLVKGREEVLIIKDPGSGDQGGSNVPQGTQGIVRRVEAALETPGEAREGKVPEAQLRRRISLRNAAAPPPTEPPGQPLVEGGQIQQPEGEAVPVDADPGEKPAEEAPPQGQ